MLIIQAFFLRDWLMGLVHALTRQRKSPREFGSLFVVSFQSLAGPPLLA